MMTGIDTKKCYGQIFLTSRMSQRTQFVKKQQRHSLLFNKLCKTSSVLLIQRHAIWLTNCAHRGRVAHSPAVSTGSWTDFLEARIKSKLGRGAAQQAESSPLMHERAVITDPGPVFDVPLSLSDVFLSSCLPVSDWHTGSWVYLSQTLCSAKVTDPLSSYCVADGPLWRPIYLYCITPITQKGTCS